jgi:hypothetical protein
MSAYICAHGERFKGKRVLELGSGLGEPPTIFSRHESLTGNSSTWVKCGDVWLLWILESVFRLQAVVSVNSVCSSGTSFPFVWISVSLVLKTCWTPTFLVAGPPGSTPSFRHHELCTSPKA